MIRVPRTLAAGRDDRSLISTIDIAPTILSLAGLRKLPEMQGFDLVRERNQAANRQFVYGELFGHNAQDFRAPVTSLISRSITNKDGWKLIVPYERNKEIPLTIGNTRPGWLQPEVELYNVEKDRSELINLAAKHPEIVTQLRVQLDRWWSPPQ
jgi:arylsulfatase A-like enzyme